MICANCGADLGGFEDRAAFICVEVMGDEYIHSFWACDACGYYTDESFRDSFTTGEHTLGGNRAISPERGREIVEEIRRCPDPSDKRCDCAVHRKWG
jgi:hypothetical protein